MHKEYQPQCVTKDVFTAAFLSWYLRNVELPHTNLKWVSYTKDFSECLSCLATLQCIDFCQVRPVSRSPKAIAKWLVLRISNVNYCRVLFGEDGFLYKLCVA